LIRTRTFGRFTSLLLISIEKDKVPERIINEFGKISNLLSTNFKKTIYFFIDVYLYFIND